MGNWQSNTTTLAAAVEQAEGESPSFPEEMCGVTREESEEVKKSLTEAFGYFSKLSKYHLVKPIGAGTFAKVYLAVGSEDGVKVAIKAISKKASVSDVSLQREVKILRSVDHENVLKLYDVDENQESLFLVTEYAPGGELLDRIFDVGVYTEHDASILFRGILSALQHLHAKGIIHRDLKPENILLASDDPRDPASVKLADFGVSSLMEGGKRSMKAKTKIGTAQYMAPEMISDVQYTESVDMWSIGVVLYIVLSGFAPFDETNMGDFIGNVQNGKFEFPDEGWKDISESAKDLVRKFLDPSPTTRITSTKALHHPWITGKTATKRPLSDNLRRQESLKALQEGKRRRVLPEDEDKTESNSSPTMSGKKRRAVEEMDISR